MKKYLLNRLSEPSTYAGLGVLLSLVGAPVSPGTLGLIQQAITAALGLFAVAVRENTP